MKCFLRLFIVYVLFEISYSEETITSVNEPPTLPITSSEFPLQCSGTLQEVVDRCNQVKGVRARQQCLTPCRNKLPDLLKLQPVLVTYSIFDTDTVGSQCYDQCISRRTLVSVADPSATEIKEKPN